MNDDQRELLMFLDLLCIKQGFCLSEVARNEVAACGPYKPDDLARIILTEEGLDPESELMLFRAVRNAYSDFVQTRIRALPPNGCEVSE